MWNKIKVATSIALFIIFAAISAFGLLPILDNPIRDYVLTSERDPSREIVIVAMDDHSLAEIGAWPFPRETMAEAVKLLTQYNAAAIGVNILYDTRTSEGADTALAAAASQTDKLVLGGVAIFDEETHAGLAQAADYIEPYEELSYAAKTGFLNITPDRDGVLRSSLSVVEYGDVTLRSLPYEVYLTYCNSTGTKENAPPLDKSGVFPINYAASPGKYTRVSFWALINDEYPPSVFENKIVLIGPYAQGISSDNIVTPLDRSEAAYGVEIYANIIQNMLDGEFKTHAPWWLSLLVFAITALVAIVAAGKLNHVWALVLTVALILLQLLLARLVYDQLDYIMHVGNIIMFLVLYYLCHLTLSILAAQSEKRHVQGVFGRFVAPEVVEELLASNVTPQLGGEEREITVLFVDIRGFTAFSEANPPKKVVEMVNRYLSLTSGSIQQYGGTIDKYIGDATMAVFNAPNNLENHALCAISAAWAMKQGSIALREEILRDYGVDLQFGIGINTGPAIVGNMGSDFRMDYTAIGDTVNTAARLESNSEKGQILISEATYQLAKDHVTVKNLGVISVKNKKVGIQIYDVTAVTPVS